MKAIILYSAIVVLAAAENWIDPFGRGKDDFRVSLPGDAYLFSEVKFGGFAQRLHVSEGMCFNFYEDWDDKLASIDLDAGTCVLAYADLDCEGKEVVRLEKGGLGTSDLSQVRMMKSISSVKRCKKFD